MQKGRGTGLRAGSLGDSDLRMATPRPCCSPDLMSHLLGKCVTEKQDFLKGEQLRKEKEQEHLRNMNLEGIWAFPWRGSVYTLCAWHWSQG